MDKKSNSYISLETATKYCHYSQEYLSLRARQGKLKALKIGRNWVTTKEWIEGYLEEVNGYKNQRAEGKMFIAKEQRRRERRERISKAPSSFLHPTFLRPSLQPVPGAWRIAIVLALVFVLGSVGVIFAYPYFEPALTLAGNFIKEGTEKITTNVEEFATAIDKGVDKISSRITESIYGFATDISIKATFLRGTQEIGKGVQKGIVFAARETVRGVRGAADGIREWLMRPVKNFAIKTTSNLIRYISQDIKAIKRFVQQTSKTVLGLFKHFPQRVVSIFKEKPKPEIPEEILTQEQIEKLVSEKFATREQLEALQQTIQKLKEEGVLVKEIIKEVTQITQVQPVTEITKKVIDDESLIKLSKQIAGIQEWEEDIQNLQTLTQKLYTHPPQTQVTTAPVYIGSQGIQIGGVATLASLGVSGFAGIKDLGVGDSTTLGSNASDKLTVNATADFLSPVTIQNTLTVGDTIDYLTVDSTGNLTTTGTITGSTTTLATLTTTGDVTVGGDLTVSGAQTYSGAAAFTASSTSPALLVNQTGTGAIVRFQDSGNTVFEIANQGALILTSTSTPQLTVRYDATNYLTTAVSAAGATTLTSTGALNLTAAATSTWQVVGAKLTIQTDTSGNILLVSAEDLTLQFATSSAFTLYHGATARLAIDTDGNIGLTGDTIITGSVTTTVDLAVQGNVTIDGDLQFLGDQNITATGTLTINPTGELYLQTGTYVDDSGNLIQPAGRYLQTEKLQFTGNITINAASSTATTTVIVTNESGQVANLQVQGDIDIQGGKITLTTGEAIDAEITDQLRISASTSTLVLINDTQKLAIDSNGIEVTGMTTTTDLYVSQSATIVGQLQIQATTSLATTTITRLSVGTTTSPYLFTVAGTGNAVFQQTGEVQITPTATTTIGAATSTPTVLTGYIRSDILPYADVQYSLGSADYRWANLYVATTTIGGTIVIGTDSIAATSTLTISSAGTSDIILSPAGYVGIGTTTPAYTLDVYGDIHSAGEVSFATDQSLSLDGSGYASIADGSQAGLDMGLSDFMVEARIKTTNSGSIMTIVDKKDRQSPYIGWDLSQNASNLIDFTIRDITGPSAHTIAASSINDGCWHYIVAIADRSSATGLKLYIDGSEVSYDTQADPTGVGSLDNSIDFQIGANDGFNYPWIGSIDEVRVWNFGKDGLPTDYADYIAWRAKNPYASSSEYNSGSWNPYADADRTEKVTDGGLENWTSDTDLTSWTENGVSAGVRDITKESTEVHGGSYAAKLEATSSDGTEFRFYQIFGLTANKYYEVTGWVYWKFRTAGMVELRLYNATDGNYMRIFPSIEAAYTQYSRVVKPTQAATNIFYCLLFGETTTGIVYYDDISVKRTGLVGHWKLNNGYIDETSNSNDLTAGGTGNTFEGGTAYFAGNISVGTTTESARLTVQTSGTTDILNLFEAGGTEVFTVLESGNVGIGTTTPTGIFVVATSTGASYFHVGTDGNVGIGTTTPSQALTVVGNIYGTGNVVFGGSVTTTGNIIPSADAQYTLGSADYRWANLYVATTTIGGTIVIGTDTIAATSTLTISSAGTSDIILAPAGYVGIGTTTPAYTLDVYGDIHSAGDVSFATDQSLSLDGSGYASIADGSQEGLDMGLSDFMLEAKVRATTGVESQRIISKREGSLGYEIFLDLTGKIYLFIGDSGGYTQVSSISTTYGDDRWHYIVVVVDRSGNAYFFKDGITDGSGSISSRSGSIDNSSPFYVGTFSVTPGSYSLTGLTDEPRVWNFGKNGLPADYATYIAWRDKNPYADISEYNSGSWNSYADADRTEIVTDGGLEAWTTDTDLTNWTEHGVETGVSDITKESTEKHGGSYAAKFEATNDDGGAFDIRQDITLTANKYYEFIGWHYYAVRTIGGIMLGIYNATDVWLVQLMQTAPDAEYTAYRSVFTPTIVTSSIRLRLYNETTTGIVYFDDISVKRTGLVGHWKFNGGYTDQTSNSNTLTEGGTGNSFEGGTGYFAGKVGIATTTPSEALTVVGNIWGSGNLVLADISATSTFYGNLAVQQTTRLGSATSTPTIFTGYVQSNIIPYADVQYTLGSADYRWANLYVATTTIGGTIVIGTDSIAATSTLTISSAGTSDIILSPAGYVGIGTTTPAYTLDVYGDIHSAGDVSFATDQSLSLDGSGYASLASTSADTGGLNMGLSDFMVEARFKTSSSGTHIDILGKGRYNVWTTPGYAGYGLIKQSNDTIRALIFRGDDSVLVTVDSASTYSDDRWHHVAAIYDRSGNMSLYIDGASVGTPASITSVANIDNDESFCVGVYYDLSTYKWTGSIDGVQVWNFGKDGLPADYADYIAWRAKNPYADISEYNSGSWNPYADADRTEKVTDGGLENWTDDTPDDWGEEDESAGTRDITDETTTIHGGSHAAKLEATNNDGTVFGIYQTITLVANKKYEISLWHHFASRTTGNLGLWWVDSAWHLFYSIVSTTTDYTRRANIFSPNQTGVMIRPRLWGEATTGIAYFDDISVKRTGLVGHWKLNGGYIDETSNSNDLTAGGSGNAFEGGTAYFAGNVGIGTTTPAETLTVVGNIWGSGNLVLTGTAATSSIAGAFYTQATTTLGSATSTPTIFTGYVQSNIIPYADVQYTLGSADYRWANLYVATTTIGGTIVIGTDTIAATSTLTISSAGTSDIILTPAGYVGIGTTTPAYTLDVYGDIHSAGEVSFATDQSLSLDGSGYGSLASTTADAGGLNMGESDFILEARIKIPSGGGPHFILDKAPDPWVGYTFYALEDGRAEVYVVDSITDAQIIGASSVCDNRWHYVVFVADRSGNGQIYVDGSPDGDAVDISAVDNIDNSGPLWVGNYGYDPGSITFTGQIDEVRVWNFGYGGLPTDYADYIAWRAKNPYADISEYDSGSWNPYADADRTEQVTDGGLENWTTDTDLTSWTESGVETGKRDITKESTTTHSGSYAAKFEATDNDGSIFWLRQTLTLDVNKYYERIFWTYYSTMTAGNLLVYIYNPTDGYLTQTALYSTTTAYAFYAGVFKPTVASNFYDLQMRSETTTGIIYYDDISVKRTGLVGHWKLNGDYTDETSNSNTLTAGGTGNTFEGGTAYFAGNVSVGTTTESARLTVQTSGTTDILNLFEAGGTEVFTVLESGNVGIGTTTPSTLLHVYGTTTAHHILPQTDAFYNLGSSAARWANLYVATTTIGGTIVIGTDTIAATSTLTISSAGTSDIILSPAGYVGIGTTTPAYTLDVYGDIHSAGDVSFATDQSLSLDGSGYASLVSSTADAGGLNMGLSDFMIEAMIKIQDLAAYNYIAYKQIGTENSGYYFRINTPTGAISARVRSGGVNADVASAAGAIVTIGQWAYIAFVVDRSSATGLKLFLSGSEVTYAVQPDPTGIGDIDTDAPFYIGVDDLFVGAVDELRVWNFGYGGLPTDYADYISWRNNYPLKDISEYNNGAWNPYADADRTDRHDYSGNVTGLVTGELYAYETALGHTLDYGGGTTSATSTFTATQATGTIASGDANDHVWRAGEVTHYKFNGDYTDETSNSNTLTEGGTGNSFEGGTAYFAGNVSVGTTTESARLTIQTSGTTDILNLIEAGGTEVFTVLESGNVGIGTTSPASLLEIYDTDASTQLTITVATSTDTFDPQIVFKTGATPATKFVLGVDYSDSNKFKIATSTTFASTTVFTIDQLGYVGIGTTTPSGKLHVAGTVYITRYNITGDAMVISSAGQIGYDIAEIYPASEPVEMGDVVMLDPQNPGTIIKSDRPYAQNLIGVVSTNAAIAFEENKIRFDPSSYEFDPLRPNIALVGRVPVKVSTENGSIEIGDPLTSSEVPGCATRATQPGMIIGTVLQGLATSTVATSTTVTTVTTIIEAYRGQSSVTTTTVTTVETSIEGPFYSPADDLFILSGETYTTSTTATSTETSTHEATSTESIATSNETFTTTTVETKQVYSKIMVFINVGFSLGTVDDEGDFIPLSDIATSTESATGTESETSTQPTLLSRFTQAVRNSLRKLGLVIEGGVAKVKKLIAGTARVDKLEMVDQVTGEIWCTWIENGQQMRVMGECDSIDFTAAQVNGEIQLDGGWSSGTSLEVEPPEETVTTTDTATTTESATTTEATTTEEIATSSEGTTTEATSTEEITTTEETVTAEATSTEETTTTTEPITTEETATTTTTETTTSQ